MYIYMYSNYIYLYFLISKNIVISTKTVRKIINFPPDLVREHITP